MKVKKYKILSIIVFVLILSLSVSSRATIIEYPIDCAGTYDRDNYWEMNFDFGVEFTDISHVYIDWEGEITAARAVKYSNPDDPFPIDVGITSNLGSNPYLRIADVWGGTIEYPNPKPFDMLSEVELVGNSTWSDLLDGKGTLKIYYSAPLIMDGYIIEYGLVTLNDSKLIIDGSLVPEPATIILLVFGALRIKYMKGNLIH